MKQQQWLTARKTSLVQPGVKSWVVASLALLLIPSRALAEDAPVAAPPASGAKDLDQGSSKSPQEAHQDGETRPRLEVRVGGGLTHSRAPDEASDTRAITAAFVGFDVIQKLQVGAGYQGQIGTWTHRFADPGGSSAVDEIRTEEWVHQVGPRVDYDVVSVPEFTLTPHVALEWLLLNSEATDLGTIGIGGGLSATYHIDPSMSIVASGDGMFATASKDTQTSTMGTITSYFGWRLGPTFHLSRISEVHVDYVGSVLEREYSSRTSHGVLLQMGLLML